MYVPKNFYNYYLSQPNYAFKGSAHVSENGTLQHIYIYLSYKMLILVKMVIVTY